MSGIRGTYFRDGRRKIGNRKFLQLNIHYDLIIMYKKYYCILLWKNNFFNFLSKENNIDFDIIYYERWAKDFRPLETLSVGKISKENLFLFEKDYP